MTTSYPYMRVAREHAAPYGHVLSYADLLAHAVEMDHLPTAHQRAARDALPEVVKHAVLHAHRAETARRRQVAQGS